MRESEQREQLAKAYGFVLPEDFWRFCRFYQELESGPQRGLLGSALGISAVGPMDWVKGYFGPGGTGGNPCGSPSAPI